MRLVLILFVSLLILCGGQGQSIFQRNGGLLRAFKGTSPDNTDRDTEVISVAGDPTQTPVVQGTDVGITVQFWSFGDRIGTMVCFQTGFCEAASTADPSWAITAPPTESPAGTGMAATHTNTLFAPYVVPYNPAAYSYSMAYRFLEYSNTYDQADIEDLLARKYDFITEDKNAITDAILATYYLFVVTWSISNAAGSENSKFQLVVLTEDNKEDYVFYLYGSMGLTGISNNVRGFLSDRYFGGYSARICSSFDTAATDIDKALLETNLPLYSNYKCGKPGNYFFDVSENATYCGLTATECSDSYTAAAPNANCNATSAPMDSCLVSSYCHRADPSDANIVNLTVSVNWYKRTANTYMQALMYSSWQSDLTMAPEEEQVFVAKDPMGVGGACGKALTVNMESITFTIDITAADAKDRCGITVDAGPPQLIYFAFKIFEYTYAATPVDDFGPNAMIDKWGDWIITGKCAPDDLALAVSVAVENKGPSTPTALPTRPRDFTFEIVNDIDDTGAVVLSTVQLGQYYYLRICFDRGLPFNEQADPFGIHTVSCSVSNKADFTVVNAAEDASVEFIEEAGGGSCPIAAGTTTGPMYMGSGFKVRSTATEYDETDATGVFPATPWCIYTDKIRAARWNKFQTMALVKKIWFKCTIGFCTKFDFTTATSEGSKCKDNCSTAKRRKREVSNDTSSYPREVLYTSVIYEEPEEARGEFCAADSSDFTIAMATVVTLIALLCVAIAAAILVFVKLLGAAKRSQKEKRFK